jgi:2-oxoisovalerate dehydrogenase E1 component
MQFFSKGQFKNPMVVRIAGYAYQKGFGGHYHNDNSIAVLRDIPGLIIASPCRGDDAVAMLRTCMAAAKVNGSVSVFLEPIALYMTKDLYESGDELWRVPYEPQASHVAIGEGKTWRDGTDLTIISWANGLWMSLRVADRLEREHGISVRVFDMRWLAPFPEEQMLLEANQTGKVLVVDETRATGGVSEGIFTALVEGGFRGELRRVAAMDSIIPLGDAANLVLVQEEEIEQAVLDMVGVEK